MITDIMTSPKNRKIKYKRRRFNLFAQSKETIDRIYKNGCLGKYMKNIEVDNEPLKQVNLA